MPSQAPNPRPKGRIESSLASATLETVEGLLHAVTKAIDDGASPRDLPALTRRADELLTRRDALRAEAEAAKPPEVDPAKVARIRVVGESA